VSFGDYASRSRTYREVRMTEEFETMEVDGVLYRRRKSGSVPSESRAAPTTPPTPAAHTRRAGNVLYGSRTACSCDRGADH
jgi:hypothetical protein